MYVAKLVEGKPGEFRVWVEDGDENVPARSRYTGPVAEVYGNKDWVHVNTDDYEGNAKINREALPKLIEALQRLDVHLSTKEE